VEDDAALASILTRTLREESYAVDHAPDGQEAEWLGFENPYDLIILDLMIPRKSGLEVLNTLRQGGVLTPVLILTAKDTKEDVVKGLDLGADDYLTKPYNLDELLARVRALIRRQGAEVSSTMDLGQLKIDTARKEVSREGVVINLTAKEYALLEYLARHVGTVLSRTQLSEHVWDMNFEPSSNVVDVYVGYLRAKIDKPFTQSMIKTVRGHGYMLDPAPLLGADADREVDIHLPQETSPAETLGDSKAADQTSAERPEPKSIDHYA
jgi:DNA-binding response OmpR family regulator